MTATKSQSVLRQIPSGVWVLGLVSMLTDISSAMVHSLLPMFMVTVLGTSVFTVGIIEGLAESTARIVKVLSGALSDYLGGAAFAGMALLGLLLRQTRSPPLTGMPGRDRSVWYDRQVTGE